MRNQQNKEKIVVSQTNVETEKKLMEYEVILIVICVFLSLIVCYVMCRQCKKRVRSWLMKEVNVVTSMPVVKVETVQPKTQQSRVVLT